MNRFAVRASDPDLKDGVCRRSRINKGSIMSSINNDAIGKIFKMLHSDALSKSIDQDFFPLRMTQFMIGAKKMEERLTRFKILDLKEQLDSDVIRWGFTPFRLLEDRSFTPTREEGRFLCVGHQSSGKRFVEIANTVLAHYRKAGGETWNWGLMSKERARFGGTSVRVGNIRLDESELNDVWIEAIDLIPYWDENAPNGVWRIERGDNHPLVKLSESISLYGPSIDGDLWKESIYESHEQKYYKASLFSDHESAQQWIDNQPKMASSKPMSVIELSGRELLKAITKLETISVDEVNYGKGWVSRHCDESAKKTKYLVSAIEKISEAQSILEPRTRERNSN